MSFLQGLFFGKSGVGGIDLGNNSIKIVQMAKTAAGYQLVRVAIAPTPPMTVKDGAIADPRVLSDAVRQNLINNKIVINKAISAVYGQSVVIRPITMTLMSERELKHAINFEAERYLPYPVAEASLNGIILHKGVEGDDKSMEVLLVAAPNEIVKNCQDVIKMAGMQPYAIDIEPFALVRALQVSVDAETFGKTIALINSGASFTSINIFKAGMLRHSRTISVAGNSFTKAIGQSLNLGFEEAEKIKKEKGAIRIEKDATPVAPTTMRIYNVIAPVLTELVTEVQRSFDYYRSRYRGENIDSVVLMGGTAKFKNIEVYLSNELSLPCQIANPFKNISVVDLPGYTADEIRQAAPTLTLVIGLALRDLMGKG